MPQMPNRDRETLDEEFMDILGNENVYFQPPENVRMSYPAIVYHLSNFNDRHADDQTYISIRSYDVTLIDKRPDSPLIDDIKNRFAYCRYVRHQTIDNLNHEYFTIYY